MEKGSRLAIYKLKEVNRGDKKFYIATLVENVYNSQKPTFKGMEPSFVKTYITDTSLCLEEAKFDLKKSSNKYSFENISNPKNSIIRLVDFKVEIHSVWNFGKQVFDNLGKPMYETVLFAKKLTPDKDFKTENSKMKELEKKIESLTKKLANTKTKSNDDKRKLREKIARLEKKTNMQSELLKEARETGIISEKKLNKKSKFKEFGDITFEDM